MTDEVVVAAPSDTPEPAGDKLDQIINSAYDTVEAAETPAETETEKAERLRDERGRFASTKPADGEAPAVADLAKPDGTTPATTVEPPTEPIQPPERWSAEDKAKFSTLPREAQSLVVERYKGMEADYTRKTQAAADRERSIEPLLAEVQRANPLLQQLGTTAPEFLNQSLNFVTNLRSGPPLQRASNIVYLADHHGIPREALAHALGISINADGQQQIAGPDPQVATLNHQVIQLQQKLQQFEQQSQLSERQRAEHEFGALALAKDETGQPKFPHFERVKQAMIQLAATGQADTWEIAYSKATRLDDDLHREMLESERKRSLEAAEKARQEAVDKAKKAQPVRTSNAMPRGDVSKKGLDAHLEAAMAKAGF